MKFKYRQIFLYTLTVYYNIFGQTILYVGLNTNVTLNCPFRQSVTDGYTLKWIGPPYTGDLGTIYITSREGANPNTVLGNRLSVVGNHAAGEYNMEISNLQQSDEGKYSCEYGNQRKYFVVVGQTIVYGRLNTDVTLNCSFRQSVTNSNTLVWIGPPYTGDLGTVYITSNDGANPDTILGNRLSVVGNHAAGEYNMKISNLQQSDEGRYTCEYGNQRKYSDLRVADTPKLEPVLTGYTPGSILYDGDLDLLLNCQQEGGNPLSLISWLNITKGVTDNSTRHTSSSYIELPVSRQLHGYTCTCLVTYPGTHAEYRRNLSVTFSVLYLSISEASGMKTYDSTDDIKLQCITNLQNNDIAFTAWTHRVGSVLIRTIPGQLSNRANALEIPFSGYQDIGIYTCYGFNKNNRRMKSRDIQINVNDQPVFTDNITITDSDRMTDINVDYFSVPKPIKVEWLKNENILYMSEKYIQNNIVTDISLTFHKVKVKIKGYRSSLSISSEEIDHGHYILRVQNAKGTVLQKIEYFPTVSQNEGMPKSTIIAVVVGFILISVITIGGILSFVCIRRKRKENNSPQRQKECDIKEDKSTYNNINIQSKTDETTYVCMKNYSSRMTLRVFTTP